MNLYEHKDYDDWPVEFNGGLDEEEKEILLDLLEERPSAAWEAVWRSGELWTENAAMIRVLEEQDADINGSFGDTLCSPLHVAVYLRNVEAVKKLLDLGADVAAVDIYGRTQLHYAVWSPASGPADVGIVAMLLHAGVDVNTQCFERECTALHIVEWPAACIELLIDYGADLEIKNTKGETSLHRWLSVSGHWLSREVDLDEVDVDNYGWKKLEVLLAAGASVTSTDIHGWTPLHTAAYSLNWDVVTLLLSYNADPDITDDDGCKAVDIAQDVKRGPNLWSVEISGAEYGHIDEIDVTQLTRYEIVDVLNKVTLKRAASVAFAMGFHERLGSNSRVRNMEPGVIKMIAEHL
jgi:hypothetical protein